MQTSLPIVIWRESAKIVLYLSMAAFFAMLGASVLSIKRDIHAAAIGLEQVTTELNVTVRTTRAALLDKQDGLLAIEHETHAAVRDVRHVATVAWDTSLQERANVAKSSGEAVALVAHADQLVENLDGRTQQITDAFMATAAHSQQTLDATSRAMDDAAHLLQDPSIPDTLGAISSSADSAALMSSDAQKKFHLLLFPPKQPWYQRTLHLIETGGRLTFDVLTVK